MLVSNGSRTAQLYTQRAPMANIYEITLDLRDPRVLAAGTRPSVVRDQNVRTIDHPIRPDLEQRPGP